MKINNNTITIIYVYCILISQNVSHCISWQFFRSLLIKLYFQLYKKNEKVDRTFCTQDMEEGQHRAYLILLLSCVCVCVFLKRCKRDHGTLKHLGFVDWNRENIFFSFPTCYFSFPSIFFLKYYKTYLASNQFT